MKTVVLASAAIAVGATAAWAQDDAAPDIDVDVERSISITRSSDDGDTGRIVMSFGDDRRHIVISDEGVIIDGESVETMVFDALADANITIELDSDGEGDLSALVDGVFDEEFAEAMAGLEDKLISMRIELAGLDIDADRRVGTRSSSNTVVLDQDDLEGATSVIVRDGQVIINGEEIELDENGRRVVVRRFHNDQPSETDETDDASEGADDGR